MGDIIESDQWQTQDDLFEVLNNEFKFEFDLCASEVNHKTRAWSNDIQTTVINGQQDHGKAFFIFFPYSRGNIDHCMKWMVELSKMVESPIVTLTRFDPTTNWFKEYVDGVADEVRMLARRLKFKGAKDSYNFPCCIAVYKPKKKGNIILRGHFKGDYMINTKYYIWDWKDD